MSSSQGAGQTQQGSGTAAAGQSAGGAEKSPAASKPAATSSDKGDPSGNNGTVKLAGYNAPNGPGHSSGTGSTPEHPSNDPHLPCDFSVEGYGFDAIATESDLTFAQHAPTKGGKQDGSLPLVQDPQSGAGTETGFDGSATYHYTWSGDPHPKHGYHIKLTAYTSYSQGSDQKHKVFWVESCQPNGETPGGETPGGGTPGGGTPGGSTPGGSTPGGSSGTQQAVSSNGGDTSTVVLGAQASVGAAQSAPAAARSAAGAQVPTAVESGLAGKGQQHQPLLPLLALLFGFGATTVALARRKASA